VIDGEKWIYNSYEQWADEIKIYSLSTIRRAIAKLESLGFLKSNFLSSKKSDRTKWYTIDYAKISESETVCIAPTEEGRGVSKVNTPSAQIAHIHNKEKQENNFKEENSLPPAVEKKIVVDEVHSDAVSVAEKLLRIWLEKAGEGRDVMLTKHRAGFLMAAFKLKFKESLDEWSRFCDAVASSDFLMGRVKSSFRASLDWVLKFETIQRILEGDFGVKLSSSKESEFMDNTQNVQEIVQDIQNLDEGSEFKHLRQRIIQGVGAQAYVTWFKKPAIVKRDNQFIMMTPNAFWKGYLLTHFGFFLDKQGVSVE
jgi:hypothetical protein